MLLVDLALHRLDLGALIRGLAIFAPAIYIRLFDPPPRRVPARPDLWRDGHDRRRLIGILMLVFEKHPNRAGADLGLKLLWSVTFFLQAPSLLTLQPPENLGAVQVS